MHIPRFAWMLIFALTAAVLCSGLTGCGGSQPPRFYTLRAVSFPAGQESSQERDLLPVGIGPIEVPDYLDQTPIVTRGAGDQLSVAEFDLWGGSFKEDVSRVLLENMNGLLKPAGVTVFFWRSQAPCAYRVPVTILRLDATRGGSVSLRARWAVMGKDFSRFLSLREVTLTRPVNGSETSSVVAAMSEALEALSREIATDVTRVSGTGRQSETQGK